jgi:DNA-binding beta-propeller fold protein YncE
MKPGFRKVVLVGLLCLLAAAVLTPVANANRTLLSEAALETTSCAKCVGPVNTSVPPPEGQIEGPCGVAILSSGHAYVADYFHRTIDLFGPPTATSPGRYTSQIILPGTNPVLGVNTLDAVCGLALDAAGNLYGNEWHQGVLRLTGGEATIDTGESTGIAIDPTSNRLYVDDRTYIAEYALPFAPGDEPLATIGSGNLSDGYGLAAFEGRVYVADAGAGNVKVFEPTTDSGAPVATIAGQFTSLSDAALAVDPTNGHLLVVDNREPGFEHPKAAVLEFASAVDGYAYLGALPGAPIDGGPSGIAVGPGGQAIVTDGNGELANAYLYGPYEAAGSLAVPGLALTRADGAAAAAPDGGGQGAVARRGPGSASASEVSQSGGVRVSFQGNLGPRLGRGEDLRRGRPRLSPAAEGRDRDQPQRPLRAQDGPNLPDRADPAGHDRRRTRRLPGIPRRRRQLLGPGPAPRAGSVSFLGQGLRLQRPLARTTRDPRPRVWRRAIAGLLHDSLRTASPAGYVWHAAARLSAGGDRQLGLHHRPLTYLRQRPQCPRIRLRRLPRPDRPSLRRLPLCTC